MKRTRIETVEKSFRFFKCIFSSHTKIEKKIQAKFSLILLGLIGKSAVTYTHTHTQTHIYAYEFVTLILLSGKSLVKLICD